jgi:hypothetical protein
MDGPTTITAPSTGQSTTAPRAAIYLLATAITLSAFLFFQIQPMIGKFILPWFGGSAGVWTTCMIFFQVVLLAGYLYAHLSLTYLPPRRHAIVHALLVVAAIMTLPTIPAGRWKPTSAADPTPRILALLISTLGLPYFVLSATAPLLQGWFVRLFPGRSPYRLYALSNVASLAALLAFPLLIEPLVSRRWQAYAWSAGYVAFALCLLACATFLLKAADTISSPQPSSDSSRSETSTSAAPRPPRTHYLLWLLLPACASLMFLAVTNKLCFDVAAVPFLWIVPLAIYLLTFILCFDGPRWYRRRYAAPVLFVAIGLGCYCLVRGHAWGIGANVASQSFTLFVCCMACHGELAALKPDPRRLTSFYLMIAAGGAVGGIFVGLVAPHVFDQFLELHVGLGLTWLLFLVARAADSASSRYRFRGPFAWFVLIVVSAVLVGALYGHATLRYGGTRTLERSRSFYGVIQVYEGVRDGAAVVIMDHNGITHGMQFEDERRRWEPPIYYRPTSGVARLLSSINAWPLRMGVIGLGTGNLATAGKSGDVVRFYELDPEVERLAKAHCTFLSASTATVEVVLGDARLSMEREPPQHYDVLVLDAFSGDAIPIHLLTREAMATYLRHLKPDGALAFHITNRHLDLAPVVNGLAGDHGMRVVLVDDNDSEWALATARQSLLESLRVPSANVKVTTPTSTRVWTDDYAGLLPIVSWRRRH